jgi:hypothetical protein
MILNVRTGQNSGLASALSNGLPVTNGITMKQPKRLSFSIFLLALAVWLPAAPVQADVFKCTDNEGHITYSNVVTKNCKALSLDPLPATSSASNAKANSAVKNPSPATFPKVDESTQKVRDTDRRRILENELATEQKNLEEAKKQVLEQEAVRMGDERNYQKVLDRVQPFKDKVALHERNIVAIKKEIANLR